MREVTEATDAAWRSQEKIGAKAPVLRVTVEKAHMRLYPYNTADTPGGDYGAERDRRGNFATFLFSTNDNDPAVRELRGVKSLSTTRSLDQDVAEATLVIFNSDITPIGNAEEDSEDFDDPGRFTFSRGTPTVETNRWGHSLSDGWDEFLAPDRLVRTFQGYGSDDTVKPAFDENLYLTGTWMIDSVEITSDATITVKMRDLGRLLLDHIAFPPVVPWEDYPLTWSKIHNDTDKGFAPAGGSYVTPGGATQSSNDKYVGEGLTDTPPPYVTAHGGVQGHYAADALHDDDGSYWLSSGQESRKSMVWWEVDLASAKELAAIKIHCVAGPYKIYVSVHDGTDWVGKRKVPYTVTTADVDIDANIPFVFSDVVNKGITTEFVLPRVYHNANRIRITFTRLRNFDGDYPWRAGLRSFQIYTGDSVSINQVEDAVKVVGNYSDWTQPVKWVCAWAGFWWPDQHKNTIIAWSDTEVRHHDHVAVDPAFPKGRVWGNFQLTGTAGVADATPDNFDKQPLMDTINYIRNIVAFFFCIDEVGGVVWRYPNLFSKGNYISPGHLSAGRHPEYVDEHLTIDEDVALIEYSTELSSANLRERIFVANSTGKVGTVVKGYAPYNTGLRRVAGWTDEHFDHERECRIAADQIAAQQMFNWRRASLTMPAHPGLQLDDQVRIYERVTNETFYHYVLSIESTHDVDAGTWIQNVTTHWLGERISDAWVVRVDQLDGATQSYLSHLGTVE